MRRPHVYIDWKKYVIPNYHPVITEYMKTKGVNFYSRVADITNLAWKEHRESAVIGKILNEDIGIVAYKKDYESILKHCLKWFEIQELYEYCAIVRDYLEEREQTRIKNPKAKYLYKTEKSI